MKSPKEGLVYTVEGSKYYHTDLCNCDLGENLITEITLEEAWKRGLVSCKQRQASDEDYLEGINQKADIESLLCQIRDAVNTIKNILRFCFGAGIISAFIYLIIIISRNS